MQKEIHYNKEIEEAVLGICLLEKLAFGRTYNLVSEDCFYFLDHQKIYSLLKTMHNESMPIDLLTVRDRIVNDKIELIENSAYALARLTMNVVSSAHLEYHCHILKDMWRKREILRITTGGIDQSKDTRQQGLSINDQINNLFTGTVKQDWYSMEQLMFDLMLHQQDIKTGVKEFVPSGFKLIDKLNGGFSPGQLIVIGARPSVGKSALAHKIVFSVAGKSKKVGVISLEMNNTEIAARMAAISTETSFGVIYRNLFTDEREHEIFYNRLVQCVNLPIFVSDKTKVDINEIRSKSEKLKHTNGLDLLVIDYLQLVDSTQNKNTNREQEVARISRGLKLLAMDLSIPVIVLCQLNRAVTHRKGNDRYPQLSDLRESGAIEQDADVVMMLHRDWMSGIETNENGESTEFDADLLGVKWRNGATFHLDLEFNPQLMKFSEQSAQYLKPIHISKNEDNEQPF
ncbi:MAG: replicative DNA helicase [Flavisolibacter sp.]